MSKVDRTCFYGELVFVRSSSAPVGLAARIVISVGTVVALWAHGSSAFLVVALTNNNGNSAIYKMVVKALLNLEEDAPNPPNCSPKTVPDKKDLSINVSEIWHIFNHQVKDIKPNEYPDDKKEALSARKRNQKVS